MDRGLAVRASRPSDAELLAPILREEDRREIDAATAERPIDALVRGVECSDPCYTVIGMDGLPVVMFGVVPDGDARGIVWLLGSEKLVEHRICFVREGRLWLDRLHERYLVLWNYIDSRNAVHVRWVSWLGFSIVRTIPNFGAARLPFHEIRRVYARHG